MAAILQRLEYECEIAQRRYELVVRPAGLIAQTLETASNERLAELETARAEDRRRHRYVRPVSTPEQTREVLGQLPKRSYGGDFDVQTRKELLRCAVEQVRLTTKGKVVRAEVVWQGGARSELGVRQPVRLSSYSNRRDLKSRKTVRRGQRQRHGSADWLRACEYNASTKHVELGAAIHQAFDERDPVQLVPTSVAQRCSGTPERSRVPRAALQLAETEWRASALRVRPVSKPRRRSTQTNVRGAWQLLARCYWIVDSQARSPQDWAASAGCAARRGRRITAFAK
jgi:hypothetical protein